MKPESLSTPGALRITQPYLAGDYRNFFANGELATKYKIIYINGSEPPWKKVNDIARVGLLNGATIFEYGGLGSLSSYAATLMRERGQSIAHVICADSQIKNILAAAANLENHGEEVIKNPPELWKGSLNDVLEEVFAKPKKPLSGIAFIHPPEQNLKLTPELIRRIFTPEARIIFY